VEVEEVIAAAPLPMPEAPRIAALEAAAAANGPAVRARRADALLAALRSAAAGAQDSALHVPSAAARRLGACRQRESSGACSPTTT